MPRFRVRTFAAGLGVSAALALTLHGQTSTGPVALDIQDVGLPAIQEDVMWTSQRTPALDAARRARADAIVRTSRRGASGRSYIPGKVIVRFRDDVASDERRTIAREASNTAEMAPRSAFADFDVVRIDPNENPEAVASALAAKPQVMYAQAAYRLHPAFVPNDPRYSTLQWNMPLINMEKAWDIQPDAGSRVTIAILDTGVAYTTLTFTVNIPGFIDQNGVRYPALGRQTIPYAAAPDLVGGASSRIVSAFDVTSGGLNPPIDFDGHGTHVSGTLGQLTNNNVSVAGVAFGAKLMPVKVLSSLWDVLFSGAADVGGSDDDVATGIRYAADHGAKVINMSLGSSGPRNCGANANQLGCSPVIESAMRYAVGKGTFIAVAGGNEFEDIDPQFGPNPTSVLAEIASRIKGVVSVGAVDPSRARAYYSTTGNYIELAAPGGSERGFSTRTDLGYVWQQTFDFNFTDTFLLPPSQYRAPRFDVLATVGYIGTSMATPHVSGVAAMVIEQGVTDPAAVEDLLEATATKVPVTNDICPSGTVAGSGRSCSFGYGLVDARAALRALGITR